MRKLLLLLTVLLSLAAQSQTSGTKANYQAAARYSPNKLSKMVFSTVVDPHWLKKSNRFWYTYETSEGKKWYIVDPVKAEKKLMFDNAKLAAELTKIVKDPMDAQHLIIDSLRFIKDENWIQFEVKSTEEIEKRDSAAKKGTPPTKEKKVYYFEYNLNTNELVTLSELKKPKRKPGWANVSPDGNTVLFQKNFNLYWMDKASYEKALQNEKDSSIVEHKISDDGVENFSYQSESNLGSGGETNTDKEKNKNNRKFVSAVWSPDSKYFAINRVDNRAVKDLWVINSVAEPRPTLQTYKYWMPGEKEAPVEYLYIYDNGSKSRKIVNVNAFKDQTIGVWNAFFIPSNRDDLTRPSVWLGTNDKFYLTRQSRDQKRLDVMVADAATGNLRTVIEERMNTYVESRRLGLVNGGKELIHWSERDGWGHFYLFDENGKLKNQITSGAFHTENILGIDEAKRVLYFSANGREANEDPYYLHAYRVNFDGSGLRLLNPGEFEHTVIADGAGNVYSFDDNKNFFVDNYSRVNAGPKSALYNTEGKKIMDLETADLSSLFAAGYKYPEVFKIKADDGITDLYGTMYKPYNFDSTKSYPLIEYVYPGPQTEAVNKAWSRPADRTDRLAQVGFVVVTVGNRGGHPSRSKWYHNYGYGNLRDYGLADKKAAVEQLTDRYKYLDINRVGIHGHSGGGFMSTAAMLVYPEVFKVAVSSSGNHDNAIYNRWWSEQHHGVKETIGEKGDTSFVYAIEKNPDLAKNLKGHLMLTTGDIDDNVSPANTIRMANALIKANKRFDLSVLPGQRHAYGDMSEYFFYLLADYYSKWLLGDFSQPVDIVEMNRDIEQSNKKK